MKSRTLPIEAVGDCAARPDQLTLRFHAPETHR